MERVAKRLRLNALPPPSSYAQNNIELNSSLPRLDGNSVGEAAQPIVAMVLDVDEGPAGSFHIWARTSDGKTALVQVNDYCPYLYVPVPVRVSSMIPAGVQTGTSGSSRVGGGGGGGGDDGAGGDDRVPSGNGGGGGGGDGGGSGSFCTTDWSYGELEALRCHWNSRLPPEARVVSITRLITRPILYYRPTAPGGAPYLRLTLRPGGSSKRAGAALEGLMSGREGAHLERRLGMRFVDKAVHEAEVKLLMRFLCDLGLSGGAWFHIPPPPPPAAPITTPTSPSSSSSLTYTPAPPVPLREAAAAVAGSDVVVTCGGKEANTALYYTPVARTSRISSCAVEVVAPWRAVHSLTPDATQLADPDWCPELVRQAVGGVNGAEGSPEGAAAILAARDGHIAELTIMTVDALAVPYDTTNRTPVTAKDDPVICIGCDVRTYGTTSRPAVGPDLCAQDSPGLAEAGRLDVSSGGGSGGGGGGGSGGGDIQQACTRGSVVVFLVAGSALTHGSPPLTRAALQGAELRCFDSEREMLLAWKEWLLEVDPDIVTTYQVRDTLGAIRDRFERLRLEGGGLLVSRMAPVYGSGGTGGAVAASPLTVKTVVMYSAAWVKRQGRMSSNSNQETFQAEVRGRVVVDVLRQVLTSQSLATFSLVDCCQTLLGETLEVLGPFHLARLAAEAQGRQSLPPAAAAAAAAAAADAAAAAAPAAPASEQWQAAAAAAARITSYIVRRVDVIVRLTSRLATLPEAFEMARVTGLTIPQVMYNAQMIRTWSLLHRNAHRQNYIIGGRQEAGNLIESPFLLHPVENLTAGLYRTPVATLDFASLYPSLYRAYNLCYTTLVHPDDVDTVGRERCGFTPTGHAFVKPEVRPGILPTILAALMSARAATRAKLKAVQYDAAAAAVLDSRQKALKITANALYGFTGAAASPLQCLPLADSCLAYGAAACRAAVQTITHAMEAASAAADGAADVGGAGGGGGGGAGLLGPAAAGGRVIYAQTDSVFVHFPRATPEEAVRLGKQAAALVTSSLPLPMELKYEKVMAPFLLLHVNRYAGRAMETEEDAASPETRGSLLVKGVRSMWRQSAPLVSQVLQGSLERILMRGDVAAAVSYAENQIRRLLSGRVDLGELAMTGGLWRITGQQVAAAAAAAASEDEGGGGGNGHAGAGGGGSAEEVRGPHAALAVRLSHRDPGRRFVLGERLSYVLLAGARTQDEAAEDPLAAAQRGAAPALELYWRNKLLPPLKELFSTCMSPTALQGLLSGPHTLVRVVDTSPLTTTAETATSSSSATHTTAGDLSSSGGAVTGAAAVSASGLLAGPGTPPAGTRRHIPGGGSGGGGGFGLSMTPRSPPSAKKSRGGRGGGGGGGGGPGGQQFGMSAFFRQSAQCLACKQALPLQQQEQRSRTEHGDTCAVPPGLCSSCLREPDTLAATYLRHLSDDNAASLHLAAALSACMRCHSGGLLGPVLCENGECPVLFARLGAARRLAASGEKLERMDQCERVQSPAAPPLPATPASQQGRR